MRVIIRVPEGGNNEQAELLQFQIMKSLVDDFVNWKLPETMPQRMISVNYVLGQKETN